MVGIVSGIGEPTRPPHQQSSMGRFDGKPVYQCMVNGCKNYMDTGSTQHLCRPCYDVITTGNTDKYCADHKGSTWISQIISWNHNLRQEVNELEYNQDHAYSFEDGTMSLTDLRNFYVQHKNLESSALNSQNLPLIHENQALKKDNKHKDEIIDDLKKKVSDLEDMYKEHCAVSHKQCSELVTHQFMVKSLKEDNEALMKDREHMSRIIDSLRKEIEALNYNIDHAHQIDFGKYMSLDDLCVFYQEHNNPTSKDDGRFQAYNEGFTKGFDMGYSKARDQFYE